MLSGVSLCSLFGPVSRELYGLLITLGRPDHQALPCRLDDFLGHRAHLVNLEDAFDLREEPLDEPEVATRDARDRRQVCWPFTDTLNGQHRAI